MINDDYIINAIEWEQILIYFCYSDMDALQVCVVKHLERCEESTPANLVESMFKFVRNETVCGNIAPVRFQSNEKKNPNLQNRLKYNYFLFSEIKDQQCYS